MISRAKRKHLHAIVVVANQNAAVDVDTHARWKIKISFVERGNSCNERAIGFEEL